MALLCADFNLPRVTETLVARQETIDNECDKTEGCPQGRHLGAVRRRRSRGLGSSLSPSTAMISDSTRSNRLRRRSSRTSSASEMSPSQWVAHHDRRVDRQEDRHPRQGEVYPITPEQTFRLVPCHGDLRGGPDPDGGLSPPSRSHSTPTIPMSEARRSGNYGASRPTALVRIRPHVCRNNCHRNRS